MRFWVGLLTVLGCVVLGYVFGGGHLFVLWQPCEFIIILGAAVGSYIISNSSHTISHTGHALGGAVAGDVSTKQDYIELLVVLFLIFKQGRSSGIVSLESHIDNPNESAIFSKYPLVLQKKWLVTFLGDYLRMMTMGCENAFQLESLMDQEIDTVAHEEGHAADALQNMADATPALGIVAAVLGVIHTMGSIDQPPAILGKLIGGALVGTFFGILVSYGIAGPLATSLKSANASKIGFLVAVRAGLIAYANGNPPIISIEFARKNIGPSLAPSFAELEKATEEAV